MRHTNAMGKSKLAIRWAVDVAILLVAIACVTLTVAEGMVEALARKAKGDTSQTGADKVGQKRS